MAKKILALVLIISVLCSFAACGGAGNQAHKLGDTVSTDIFKFTLYNADLAIALENEIGENYASPKEFDATDDANNPYVAKTGHTFIAITYEVESLDRASAEFHEGSFIKAKYNKKNYSKYEECAYFCFGDKKVISSSGAMSTESGYQWRNEPSLNMLLKAGEKEMRRGYVDMDVAAASLDDEFELTISIPKSDGGKEKFKYTITAEDRANPVKREISVEEAAATFTSESGQKYFVENLETFPKISGKEIENIIVGGNWNTKYRLLEISGEWVGTFMFQKDGRIKDSYGYVNERTWSVKGDNIIFDGDEVCEMRKVADKTYLFVCEGKPYILINK